MRLQYGTKELVSFRPAAWASQPRRDGKRRSITVLFGLQRAQFADGFSRTKSHRFAAAQLKQLKMESR
jgi:hypothetical protein